MSDSVWRSAAVLAGAFVAFWVAMAAHEGAHLAVASFVYSTAELAAPPLPARDQLLVVGAGPLTTLTIVALCALVARSAAGARHATGVSALLAGAAIRVVFIAWGTLTGFAVNDERTVGRLLGISPRLLWLAEAMFVAVVCYRVFALIPVARRRRTIALLVAGAAAGMISGLTIGRAFGLPI